MLETLKENVWKLVSTETAPTYACPAMKEKMNKITTVVTTFDDNIGKYLDVTLESILRQEDVDNEIILVSSQNIDPVIPNNVKLFKQPREKTNCQNVNFGFRQARPESTLFFTVNDDVILGKQSLYVMAEYAQRLNLIMGALSNTDLGWMYATDFIFLDKNGNHVSVPKTCTFKEVESIHESIMTSSFVNIGLPMLWYQSVLCTYANMFPRKVWEDLGGYDEVNLGSGATDIDICWRARDKGIRCAITTQAFALHMGGVTSSKTIDSDKRLRDKELFKKKWGVYPP